jgi:hypothetical protein
MVVTITIADADQIEVNAFSRDSYEQPLMYGPTVLAAESSTFLLLLIQPPDQLPFHNWYPCIPRKLLFHFSSVLNLLLY